MGVERARESGDCAAQRERREPDHPHVDADAARRVLVLAWTVYALAYAAFGFVRDPYAAWLLLAPYAAYYGLAEGGQRALLAELVPDGATGWDSTAVTVT